MTKFYKPILFELKKNITHLEVWFQGYFPHISYFSTYYGLTWVLYRWRRMSCGLINISSGHPILIWRVFIVQNFVQNFMLVWDATLEKSQSKWEGISSILSLIQNRRGLRPIFQFWVNHDQSLHVVITQTPQNCNLRFKYYLVHQNATHSLWHPSFILRLIIHSPHP